MFLKKYFDIIVINEFWFVFLLVFKLKQFLCVLNLLYFNFFKFNVHIFSRLYRSLRLMFSFSKIFIKMYFNKYLNKKNFLLRLFLFEISLFNSFFFFENFVVKIFKYFFRYEVCLYMYCTILNNNYFKFKFIWSDLYSIIRDLSDMIMFRELYLFKLNLFRIIYYLDLIGLFNLVFFKFLNIEKKEKKKFMKFFFFKFFNLIGFKFFFKNYKYNFFVRVI